MKLYTSCLLRLGFVKCGSKPAVEIETATAAPASTLIQEEVPAAPVAPASLGAIIKRPKKNNSLGGCIDACWDRFGNDLPPMAHNKFESDDYPHDLPPMAR